ncbi:MAG: hypothetical protein H7144_04580, partial [Burkholderiales bacterium]|nr:hypothetical protein [Phycisphaerae bacterium]
MSYNAPCKSVDELRQWLMIYLDLKMPAQAVCTHHQSPMDYLAAAYFEPAKDQVVWAPRGGGKTTLAAAATLLDLLHKPGCSVRILGGSLDQSLRTWDTLVGWFHERFKGELVDPSATARRLRLRNGSTAAVLTQSQKSVRGLRVQKLRCDEVELFDPAIWSAAQMVTRSQRTTEQENTASTQLVRGTIEALSTLHKSHGLMKKIVDQAGTSGAAIVRWCLLDVLEQCPPQRECDKCPLWQECQGAAKTRCDGFFRIDDAISIKSRVSDDVWQTEMMCLRPSTHGSIFPMLDPARHVVDTPPFSLKSNCEWWLAIDFGFSAPLVCLWIAVSGDRIYVVDEHILRERTLEQHLAMIEAREWPRAPRIACDPAGGGRNE